MKDNKMNYPSAGKCVKIRIEEKHEDGTTLYIHVGKALAPVYSK